MNGNLDSNLFSRFSLEMVAIILTLS